MIRKPQQFWAHRIPARWDKTEDNAEDGPSIATAVMMAGAISVLALYFCL